MAYAKRYGIVPILLVGWVTYWLDSSILLSSFQISVQFYKWRLSNFYPRLWQWEIEYIRYVVMVVKCGCMRNVIKSLVIISRFFINLDLLVVQSSLRRFLQSYMSKSFCRILEQPNTIAQIARRSSTLSYRIQKLVSLKTGKFLIHIQSLSPSGLQTVVYLIKTTFVFQIYKKTGGYGAAW